ncbi:unnamed protein product [Amoebophrya sp. A25]|nr:unnamed protein product [Amoebophrya sp. A25]|eukprot:GSA25T00009574001.1
MSLQDFRRGRGVWKRQVETKATTLSWEEWHREYRMDFPDCIDEERRRRLQTLAKNAALKRRAELIAPGIGDLEGEELGQALSKYASTYETNVLVRLVGKPDRPPSAANTSKRPRKVNPRRVMKKKGKKKRKGNIKKEERAK